MTDIAIDAAARIISDLISCTDDRDQPAVENAIAWLKRHNQAPGMWLPPPLRTDILAAAMNICRLFHRVPCDEACEWCKAEAEIELAARGDDRPGRVWPMDSHDADLRGL